MFSEKECKKKIPGRTRANEFLRQQKRLRFSCARNKDGIFDEDFVRISQCKG